MTTFSPLSITVFATATLVIIFAQSLLIFSAWQYTRQVKHDTGAIHTGAKFELMWAIAPVVFLVLILWFSTQALIR
jgi:heme/copper-type cytochrome/quinol oxidase subunit 2